MAKVMKRIGSSIMNIITSIMKKMFQAHRTEELQYENILKNQRAEDDHHLTSFNSKGMNLVIAWTFI